MNELYKKHSSKLYLGFCKQYIRQCNKPREKRIELPAIVLPKNFKGDYQHYIDISNSIWNGMNLANLKNASAPKIHIGGMYGKFSLNKDGKYSLSNYGKSILRKKREKLNKKA